MQVKRHRKFAAALGVFLALTAPTWADGTGGDVRDKLGPRFAAPPAHRQAPRIQPARRGTDATSRLIYWNEIAINASGLDHTPAAEGENRVFGEQLGPGRSSRAMAIVHIAMFDAMNAIVGGYEGYTDLKRAPADTSIEAAIAQAAHDTLVVLFPSQRASFDDLLAEDLRQIRPRDRRAKERGIELGRDAAAAILALRASDGSQHAEPRVNVDYTMGDQPGQWRQDPISRIPLALGAHWSEVKPFVLKTVDMFRTPPPPALDTPEYAAAYQEAKTFGGDGVVTPTQRTQDQTEMAIFWAYDGTPSLCAPPRLYNQIAVQIGQQMGSKGIELARLLALMNVALADAGTAVWESKYYYGFWRPITGIRESDEGTGPTGAGDGNADTLGDANFTPLGAPASNLTGPNFTPPFPAYPSGHAGFGGALFQILRRFYGTDDIAFTFMSDEMNGVTRDHDGNVRPASPRSFTTLSQAEEENGQSRIYLGIHWEFDKTAGITQGREVANYVFKKSFKPLRQKPRRERKKDGDDES